MLLILNYLATLLFRGTNESRKFPGLGFSFLDISRFDGLAFILLLLVSRTLVSKTLPIAVSTLITVSNNVAIFSSIFLVRLYIFSSTLSSVIIKLLCVV